jgi:biopolymer transport protein ExbD
MQQVARIILTPILLAAIMTGAARATENGPALPEPMTTTAPAAPAPAPEKHAKPVEAEYKRADTNFYAKGDILKTHSSPVILPLTAVTPRGDSYFFTPKVRAPKELFVETTADWIEPITPPDMPASLAIAPDAMQIREPQGDVQVAFPAAPTNYVQATDGMPLLNGVVIKTGANGTAAVLFGGVDSARLMPNSEAAVQQTVTDKNRSVEVDLTSGGVFSKVGTQVGVKGRYEVHTSFGNATATGGDFVTIADSARMDVWVAQGTIALEQPNSKTAETVTSDGTGPLKLMRFPAIADAKQSAQADSETLTAAMNFIPLANQKLKALRAKAAAGTALTANEQAYFKRIKQVPSLIMLAYVEPPAPPAPVATAPAELPAPHLALAHVETLSSPPIAIDLHADGTLALDGVATTLDDLKARIASAAQADPNQKIVLTPSEKSTHQQIKDIVAICHASKLKVKLAKATKAPAAVVTAPPVPAPVPVPAPAPVPANVPEPITTTSSPVLTPIPAVAPAPTPAAAPADLKPLNVVVHVDGTIRFQGKVTNLADFQAKLKAVAQATPTRSLLIKALATVPADTLKSVTDSCDSDGLKYTTLTLPAPATPVATAVAATTNVTAPAPATPATASAKPLPVNIHVDGSVGFGGKSMDLAAFQKKLAAIAKTSPEQAFIVHTVTDVPADKIQPVMDSFHAAHFNNATLAPPTVAAAPAVPAQPAVAVDAPKTTTDSSVPATTLPDATAAPSGTKLLPINLDLRSDGNVDFQFSTLTLDDLKPKLETIAQATPNQPIVINGREKVSSDQLKKVIAVVRAAHLKKVTVTKPLQTHPNPPADTAAATNEHPAENLPTPGLLMHPSVEPLPTSPSTSTPPASGP